MPKYKRIQTTITANQYLGEIVPGICDDSKCFINLESNGKSHHVHTIHNNQPVCVEVGDYIIPEPNEKNFYPCKAEIFEKTYRPLIKEVSH